MPPNYTDLEANLNVGGEPNRTNDAATQNQNMFDKSSHPLALLFYLLFKVISIGLYLFGTLFTDRFVLLFLLCIFSLSCDFWTVKNISGRYLVGLRWWNEVDDEGNNIWLFESHDPNRNNTSDSKIFWFLLYATPVTWALFALVAIIGLKFQWLLIVAVALILSSVNFMGYTRCDRDARQKWTGTSSTYQPSQFLGGLMTKYVSGNLFGRFF